MKKINALGQKCPIPVIEMKKALKNNQQVEITVDNEISTQNLKKLADEYHFDYNVHKEADQHYLVTFTKTEESISPNDIANEEKEEVVNPNDYYVVIDDNQMGNGDSNLGKNLLKSFFYALTEQDILPTCLIFYNNGVHITAEENTITEDLKKLTEAGVRVLTCGLCLDYYGYDKEKISIGSVTNMYEIVKLMRSSNRIVNP